MQAPAVPVAGHDTQLLLKSPVTSASGPIRWCHTLQKAGCDNIYQDTISGTKSQRPGLDQALDNLREGDTLVVWKLDRLGRSVKDLLDFAGRLNDRGVGFVSLTDVIDTTTVSGRFFFNVMASLAQMERGPMVARTQAGLPASREPRTGRRPQTHHDGCQDPLSPKAPQPGNTAPGGRRHPGSLRTHPLPMGPGSNRPRHQRSSSCWLVQRTTEQNAFPCRALLTSQCPYSSALPRNSAGASAVDF
ncbi:hypothetical protein ARTHRO9V_280214 [Arthrobacter sp. 9V]|nr:hypothetical protein ARTHRO9V_280214 [Arthrobacter sp. 9V]